MRPECDKCNHFPVCKDELKNDLEQDCPFYEGPIESVINQSILNGMDTKMQDDLNASNIIAIKCMNLMDKLSNDFLVKITAAKMIGSFAEYYHDQILANKQTA